MAAAGARIGAIGFGVLAFFWPGLTLITLTWLWGAYALTDGVIAIWAAFNASGGDAGPRWWLGLSGVVSILAGVVAFYYTGMTTLVLLMFIAVWAIIIGAIQIWGPSRCAASCNTNGCSFSMACCRSPLASS